MYKSIVTWLSDRGQLITRLLLLAITTAVLAISIRVWLLVDRTSRPELSINDIYLSPDRGYPLALVIDYQNVGRTSMTWLQILAVLLYGDVTGDIYGDMRKNLSVVRINPTPGGVTKVIVTEVKLPPPQVILCARWLGQRGPLSSSEWIYQLEPQRPDSRILRYGEPQPNLYMEIKAANPCSAQYR